MKEELQCPDCGSATVSRGEYVSCKVCGKRTAKSKLRDTETSIVGNSVTQVITGQAEHMTEMELLLYLGVDPNEWDVTKVKYSRNPIYRKDRQSEWEKDDGEEGMGHGWSKDAGKLLVKHVYGVQVWITRKTEQIKATLSVDGIIERLEKASPKVPKFTYKSSKDGMLLQVMMPDIHFGRRTWGNETAENYDMMIAHQIVHEALSSMLAKARGQNIAKVLFLFGNDAFNVDNEHNTTAHGTPQQEESEFAETFIAGERLLDSIVKRLLDVAPVDLLFIPGNHDPHRLFYLGRVAQALYSRNKNIRVANSTKSRQYYTFGRNLFGFTHGDGIKISKLSSIMPLEVPELWAKSSHREWHMGHFHHKQEMEFIAYDDIGVTLRFFRSLTAADRWTFNKGFIGSPKGAESILWTPNDGIFAQYPATIKQSTYLQ